MDNVPQTSLFTPQFERGNCGIGFVADQFGRASHTILRQALEALVRLEHRGAVADDATTGDGAGVLTPLPRQLFVREAERLAGLSPDPDQLGVGVFFFQPGSEELCRALAEAACQAQGLRVICWRDVPVRPAAIAARSRATHPLSPQLLLTPASRRSPRQF